MTDWISDGVAAAAALVAAVSFIDGRRQGRRQQATDKMAAQAQAAATEAQRVAAAAQAAVAQVETERRAEELRPVFVVEEVLNERFNDDGFTVRVKSQCDRPLHVSEVVVVEDPQLPSALAGMLMPTSTNIVQKQEMDEPLRPHGAFKLELIRRHSLQRTNGTGQITVQIEEPGTDRSWQITLVVEVPRLPGEAPHTGGGRVIAPRPS